MVIQPAHFNHFQECIVCLCVQRTCFGTSGWGLKSNDGRETLGQRTPLIGSGVSGRGLVSRCGTSLEAPRHANYIDLIRELVGCYQLYQCICVYLKRDPLEEGNRPTPFLHVKHALEEGNRPKHPLVVFFFHILGF